MKDGRKENRGICIELIKKFACGGIVIGKETEGEKHTEEIEEEDERE